MMVAQPIPVIQTHRLFLQPLCLEDAQSIQQIFPQWDIVRLLSAHIPWPYPKDGALIFLRDIALPAMQNGRAWYWSIRTQDDPEQLIGVISLHDTPDDNRGFWLCPQWQGKGFMTEACEAVTDFWFTTLNRPVLRTPKACENDASRRISVRSGMRLVWTGERDYVCGRRQTEIWEITADEWKAHHN